MGRGAGQTSGAVVDSERKKREGKDDGVKKTRMLSLGLELYVLVLGLNPWALFTSDSVLYLCDLLYHPNSKLRAMHCTH